MTSSSASRAGAFLLAAALFVPTVAGNLAHWRALDVNDATPGLFWAYNLLLFAAVCAVIAAVAVFLFARGIPAGHEAKSRVPALLGFAAVRVVASLAAIAVIVWAPELSTWQAALGLALPDIFFVVTLCGVLGALFEPTDAALAKNTARFGYVYAAYKLALLLSWALPDAWQQVVTTSHRITGPMLAVVIAILLWKASRSR